MKYSLEQWFLWFVIYSFYRLVYEKYPLLRGRKAGQPRLSQRAGVSYLRHRRSRGGVRPFVVGG